MQSIQCVFKDYRRCTLVTINLCFSASNPPLTYDSSKLQNIEIGLSSDVVKKEK